MTTEQCLALELQKIKTSTRYLLRLYGMEDYQIDELFSNAHDLVWGLYAPDKEDKKMTEVEVLRTVLMGIMYTHGANMGYCEQLYSCNSQFMCGTKRETNDD